MKTLLVFLFSSILLLSCSNDDGIDENANKRSTSQKAVYKFESITYEAGEKNLTIVSRALSPISYRNGTSIAQRYTSDLLSGVSETSQFLSEDKDAFTIINADTIFVNTPIEIQNKTITLGGAKWQYTNELILLPSMLNFKQEYTIQPYTKLILNMTLVEYQYTANYTLTCREVNTGEEKIIKGTWKGTLIKRLERDAVFENVNEM